MVNCTKCGLELPVTEVRAHQSVCGAKTKEQEDLVPDNLITILDGDKNSPQPNQADVIDEENILAGGVSGENRKSSIEGAVDSLQYLKDIFPLLSEETLQKSLESKSGKVSDVIEEIFETGNCFEEDEFPDFEAMMQNDVNEQLTLAECVRKLAPANIIPHRLCVNRESLFQDSVSLFKKSSFDFGSPVKIVFENEPAIDGGGPRREYFTLLLRSLVSPGNFVRLFEGAENQLIPMHNTDAIRANLFKVTGRMIAASIVNGGPGFPCLSPAVYAYLVSNSCQGIDIVKEDIADLEIRQVLTLIDTLEDFNTIPEAINDALVETGFTKRLSKANKLEAISSIMLNSVILSRKAELDQLAEGLGPVLREARLRPEIVKPLFVHSDGMCLTPEIFKSLLLDQNLDSTMKDYFYKFIEQQDEKVLQQLLAFCTGTNCVPPMGFHDPDSITVGTIDSTLPNANTCPMELELPMKVACFDEFSRQMKVALDSQAIGFGIV